MIIDPKTREATYTMEELQRIRSKLMVAFQLCHKTCPLALEALNDAPEDSWVSVFAEKAETVREWANVQLETETGEIRLAWRKSEAECVEALESAAVHSTGRFQFLFRLCRERQPDGRWRAVTANPIDAWNSRMDALGAKRGTWEDLESAVKPRPEGV